GGRLGEGAGAGERELGAELAEPATGEPAGDRPAQGEDVERLASGEPGVEGVAVAVDDRQDGVDRAPEAAAGVERGGQGQSLGDRGVRRVLELAQLEHGDPGDLSRAGAEALRTGGGAVDEGVEAGPVAQDAVDEGGGQAALAP